jgi:hypothetical protein
MAMIRQRAWSFPGVAWLGVFTFISCDTRPAAHIERTSELGVPQSRLVQSLQKQIREKDKYIAELESRLDALKIIDQDIEKRRNVSRPPATLTPAD